MQYHTCISLVPRRPGIYYCIDYQFWGLSGETLLCVSGLVEEHGCSGETSPPISTRRTPVRVEEVRE